VGDYTFEVVAVDRDLVHSENPATVALQVYYQPMSSSVRVSDLRVQDVFASFHKTYAEHSIGSARVVNDDPNPVDATLSFYIPDLMARPTEHTVSLEPKSSQHVLIRAILSPSILNLRGDTRVQAEVALSCEVGGQIISVKEPQSITVYGRGALTWDVLGRAGAFVTPEDGSVAALARGLYERYRHQIRRKKIDGEIPAAALVFEALGALGIRYAQDSSTPYSQVRGDRSAVDHIQYPAELLKSKMGDCDDCTVLYCALLENLNIATALVDAPSHVLMMFDSGVTSQRNLGFSLDEHWYVERGDRIWIPVEVTALGERPFMEAWELGAETCERLTADGELQITDIRQVWARYPYALPEVEGLDLELPASEVLEDAFAEYISGMQRARDDYVKRHYVLPLLGNPSEHERRAAFGRARLEAGDYLDAIAILMPLLDTDLKSEAYYLIGYAYVGQKDYALAVRHFENALQHDPENEDYAEGLRVLRGVLKRQQGSPN